MPVATQPALFNRQDWKLTIQNKLEKVDSKLKAARSTTFIKENGTSMNI